MTSDAYDVIRRDVHARIDRRRLRPEADLERGPRRGRRAGRRVPAVARARRGAAARRPRRDGATACCGRSPISAPLTELLARRDVEEIFIEGARVSYLDGPGGCAGSPCPTSEEENRQVVERMLAVTERQLNTKHPMVQARVLGGTARLTAAIPPVGDQLSATMRRYVVRNVTLDDLVRARLADAGGGRVPHGCSCSSAAGSRCRASPARGRRRCVAALLAAAPPETLRAGVRGDPRAGGADHPRLVLRGAAAGARRHRRDQPARPRQVRARRCGRIGSSSARCAAPRRSS